MATADTMDRGADKPSRPKAKQDNSPGAKKARQKAFYHKQRVDAEARGDQGTVDKIYGKLGKRGPNVEKNPIARVGKNVMRAGYDLESKIHPAFSGASEIVQDAAIGGAGAKALGNIGRKAIGAGARALGRRFGGRVQSVGEDIGRQVKAKSSDITTNAPKAAAKVKSPVKPKATAAPKSKPVDKEDPIMNKMKRSLKVKEGKMPAKKGIHNTMSKAQRGKSLGKKGTEPAPKPKASAAPAKPKFVDKEDPVARDEAKAADKMKPTKNAPKPKASSAPRPARTPSPPEVREKAKSDYESFRKKTPQKPGEGKREYNQRTYQAFKQSRKKTNAKAGT